MKTRIKYSPDDAPDLEYTKEVNGHITLQQAHENLAAMFSEADQDEWSADDVGLFYTVTIEHT